MWELYPGPVTPLHHLLTLRLSLLTCTQCLGSVLPRDQEYWDMCWVLERQVKRQPLCPTGLLMGKANLCTDGQSRAPSESALVLKCGAHSGQQLLQQWPCHCLPAPGACDRLGRERSEQNQFASFTAQPIMAVGVEHLQVQF